MTAVAPGGPDRVPEIGDLLLSPLVTVWTVEAFEVDVLGLRLYQIKERDSGRVRNSEERELAKWTIVS